MEKTINEIKDMLSGMEEDLDKFNNKGQNAAGTRIRKSLNEIRKACKTARDEVKAIKTQRRAEKPAKEPKVPADAPVA